MRLYKTLFSVYFFFILPLFVSLLPSYEVVWQSVLSDLSLPSQDRTCSCLTKPHAVHPASACAILDVPHRAIGGDQI